MLTNSATSSTPSLPKPTPSPTAAPAPQVQRADTSSPLPTRSTALSAGTAPTGFSGASSFEPSGLSANGTVKAAFGTVTPPTSTAPVEDVFVSADTAAAAPTRNAEPLVDNRIRAQVDTVLAPDATPAQRKEAYRLVQEEVGRLGGLGDSGINPHAIPAQAAEVLREAGIPTLAGQEVIETVDEQLPIDATPAQRRKAYETVQNYVDRVGGRGDSGINREALPERARALLIEAGVPVRPEDLGTPLTEAEREEAREIAQGVATRELPAQAIADFLEDHPDPAAHADFWREFTADPQTAAFAFERLDYVKDPADQQRVGESLAHAVEQGVLSPEDFSYGYLIGGSTLETNENLGKIIAATGDEEVINQYVTSELEIAEDDARFEDRAAAAAFALEGLSPEDFQTFLEDRPDDVQKILGFLPPDSGITQYPAEQSPALGALLDRAASVTPPTPETVQLFTDLLPKLEGNADARNAAANFFIQHQDALLAASPQGVGFVGPNGAISPDKQAVLSELFAQTLFTEPRPANAGVLEESIANQLGELQEGLNRYQNANPNRIPNSAVESARTLGSLIGTLEAGFQVAVDRIEQKNEAIDGAASLFQTIGGVIPDLPFPGGGLVKDRGIDELTEYFSDRAKEDAPDTDEAIPFHQSFGSTLVNGTLATAYDAARSEAYISNQLGLTNPDE